MRAQDIKNLYPITPETHNNIVSTLNTLENTRPVRSQKRRNLRRLTVAFAIIAILGALTTAAYATNLFGLLSEHVGKYGLNLSVVEETSQPSAAEKKPVKLKLGYIPEGCIPLTENGEQVSEYSYCTGGDWESAEIAFSFYILDAQQFYSEDTYIVDSFEAEYNGHKVIIETQQLIENGVKSYSAAEYFEDWGYVVMCHCNNLDELIKIMEHLDLEEDTTYIQPTTTTDEYHDEVDDYTYDFSEEYRFVNIGENFEYSDKVINNSPSDFTIQVKSVEEHNSFDGLNTDSFMYPHLFSEYFDEDNNLITPYMREDQSNGDGINELIKYYQTKTNRHFILVTVTATANADLDTYSRFDIWSMPIERKSDDTYGYPDGYGNVDLVYQNSPDNADSAWDKGETRTFVYGIMVDDEVSDCSCLYFRSVQYHIDDTAETFGQTENYTCVMLKGAVKDD